MSKTAIWATVVGLIAFFALMMGGLSAENYLDGRQLEICVSNGGQWVDGDDGLAVRMECQRP